MPSFFQNKIVAITGGTSGIGKALAIQCIQNGASVAICGRQEDKLTEFYKAMNSENLLVVTADVSAEKDCELFIQKTVAHFGGLDILINNAGISMRAMFEDMSLDVLKTCMDINFWGTVYTSKFALPHIKKSKGSIVGISSIAGYKGLPCRTGYSSSKFAMQGFLESLRIELLHTGVNVLWVSPGFVASNIRNSALNAAGGKQSETPLDEKKLMSAEECASIILSAIEKRKRTVIMTTQGKLTVWLNKFFPSFVDKQVFSHFANEENSPLKK